MRARNGERGAVGRIGALLLTGGLAAPSFQGLGDLPGGEVYSVANGISGDGTTVVGGSRSAAGPGSIEAFRWTEAEGMVGIGDFGSGAPKSTARAASFDGSVIVGMGDSALALSSRVPFRWTAATGRVVLTDSAGAIGGGEARDVSDDGSVVVGVRNTVLGNEAFRWTASAGMIGVGWLPSQTKDSYLFGVSDDGAVACGLSMSGSGADVEPTRWTGSIGLVGLGDVPGGIFYAIAWGVSGDGGTIAGGARTMTSNDEMFLWREGVGFILPDPLHGTTFSSSAFAVSGDGSVAVGFDGSGAMIWDALHGMRSLRAVLEDDLGLDLSGWQLGAAADVSRDGLSIAGTGLNPSGKSEAWIARLPAAAVGLPPAARTPDRLVLTPIGPNPASGASAFRLVLGGAGGPVRAAIVAPDGRRVRDLLDARLPAGSHEIAWDGRDGAGRTAAAGTYLLSVVSPHGAASAKITRIR